MAAGKVALITGGASGIGRAIAEELHAGGAHIAIADVEHEAGTALADKLGALFIAADIGKQDDCRELIEQVVGAYGAIHILVNNAGFQHIDPIERFPDDVWDKMMAVMLRGPFLLSRYSWPHMKAQQWGRILNIASIHAVVASPYKSGYVTAKHALLGLTRTLSLEGGPYGITAHAICPSYTRTPLVEEQITRLAETRGLHPEEVVEKVMLDRATVKRLIEPSEIAALATFLCSEHATAMTGAPIMIDAGWTVGT